MADLNPLFVGRLRAIVRGAAAEHGSVAALSRRWGIAETTLGDFIRGTTKQLSEKTLSAIADAWAVHSKYEQWRILSAADLMAGRGWQRVRANLEQARKDPERWRARVNAQMTRWREEQERREERGAPGQPSYSP